MVFTASSDGELWPLQRLAVDQKVHVVVFIVANPRLVLAEGNSRPDLRPVLRAHKPPLKLWREDDAAYLYITRALIPASLTSAEPRSIQNGQPLRAATFTEANAFNFLSNLRAWTINDS